VILSEFDIRHASLSRTLLDKVSEKMRWPKVSRRFNLPQPARLYGWGNGKV